MRDRGRSVQRLMKTVGDNRANSQRIYRIFVKADPHANGDGLCFDLTAIRRNAMGI